MPNQQDVSWSLAPTTRNTRFPFHAAGTVMSRRYQPTSASSFTPDAGEPQPNGTRMRCGNAVSGAANHLSFTPASALSGAKHQLPLRFCHSARSQSGRGCSGSGIFSAATANVAVANAQITVLIFIMFSIPFNKIIIFFNTETQSHRACFMNM